jgi:glycosyltransferase involved in cell wall biosynthesis
MSKELDRVVVINDDIVARGGAAAVALASARLLCAQGVPVTYLSGEEPAAGEPALAGVEVVVLGGRHLLQGSRTKAAVRGLYDRTSGAALQRWMAANDTPGTVYHLHNWHKVLSPSIFRPLRDAGRRLVISAHDYFLACPNGAYFVYPRQSPCELRPGSLRCIATSCDRRHYGHKLWRLVRHRLRQSLLNLESGEATVVAVHEGAVPYLARAGIAPRNIRVLRNPVMPWRQARVAAEDNRDLFFVGRLEEDKGIDLLAAAAAHAGLPIQLIGDGALAAALRRYPGLQLHGWQPRERIAELIGKARLVVLPSRCRETFGLAAFEALMSGVPVVVSRFAAIADEVAKSGFGRVCDPYDGAALAALLRELAGDGRQIEEMSRRAFAGARRLAPTPAEWCDGLLRLYAERLDDAGQWQGRRRGSGGAPRRPVPPLSAPAAATRAR